MPVDRQALRASLRRSLGRTLAFGFGAALAIAALVGTAAVIAGGAHREAIAVVVVAMLIGGGLAGFLALRLLVTTLANLSARPVELLLEQPYVEADLGSETLHWLEARALRSTEIEEDIFALRRIMRRAARRSGEAMDALAKAKDAASQQSLAKSQFLAKMSHELRTPLNAILGYATLLHEDAVETENGSAVADLERIQLAGRNLLTVINDILDLAKIDSGAGAVNRQVINTRELVEAVVAASDVATENGNRFELTLAEDVGIIIGDGTKLRQCLLNLLSNASKFTRNGRIALSVTSSQNGGVPAVEFCIRDTGIGIDAADLPHLFDAFSQVREDELRRGGVGLGLAITRRLARKMGGDCSAESVKNVGSTFRLTVPLSPAAQEQEKLAERAVPQKPQAIHQDAMPCALVIDDDESTLDLVRRWIEPMGFNVLTALNGEQGMAMARQHRPDLILLDALLPGRTGYEIVADMRGDPAVCGIPVILITVDDDRARGIESGACDYLRKPLSEASLREAVEIYRRRESGDVLVIEDDDDAAELVKRSVEQAGYSTRRASTGLEGIAMAIDRPPAAIVLDVRLPELDGFGVIERLASADGLGKVPLVIVSGCDLTLAQHRKLAAAGHRFFTKGTATPREIAQSIRDMVA